MKIKRLTNPPDPNQWNLHRIAISNLQDPERRAIRYWCKKYQTPAKPLDEHTVEELIVEQLEDFYEANPEEITKFMANEVDASDWDGTMSDAHEEKMRRHWKKKTVDVSGLQDFTELSEEEEAQILANLGRSTKAPGPAKAPNAVGEEFEEHF